MGLSSRNRVLGTMRLDFLSPSEVAVMDQIPDATREMPYPLGFAFLYAGKLLSNFPPPSGQDVLRKALSVLGSHANSDKPLGYNASMLGVCCERPIAIVAAGQIGRWIYSGELVAKDESLLVNTTIAHGDEDHFHRAAIDVAFEIVRRRLGEKGGAVWTATPVVVCPSMSNKRVNPSAGARRRGWAACDARRGLRSESGST